MEYLLKSSVLIIFFYGCYKLLLQRETFFNGNRWFLLLGLIASILIPLMVIPIYVEIDPIINQNFVVDSTFADTSMINSTESEKAFEFFDLLPIVYRLGILFFLGKFILELISLGLLIKRNCSLKNYYYKYIETDSNLAPFSFFNWIVHNPKQFDANELNLILNHEKVHVRQFHSVDVIFSQLACIVFWFNPFIWFYKKALQQNLEFIADQKAQHFASSQKTYQNLLLKTTLSCQPLALTNNFYNSLIKKRIVMLHTSKSNKMNAYKYGLILPFLAVFIFNFNTEIVAQTTENNTATEHAQNVLKYVVTKDTKDKQLESIKKKMAEKEVTIVYKDLKRNDKKEITGIRIEYDSKKGSGEFFVNSDEPIADIAITLNVNENKFSIGQAMKNLSQSFEIINEDGEKKVNTSKTENNVLVYSKDDTDEKVTVVGKDGDEHDVKKEKNVYVLKTSSVKDSSEDDIVFVKNNKKDTVWIKQDVKNITFLNDDGKDLPIIALDNGDKNRNKFTSAFDKPLILMDGKEISSSEMSNIKTGNILSVNVLKGESAIKKYGPKGKDGVIYIQMKDDASLNGANETIAIGEKTLINKKDKNSKDNTNPWAIKTEITTTDDSDNGHVLKSYQTSIITKNTEDKFLEIHKKDLKSKGVTFNYSKLKRNKEGLIVKLKVELSDGKGTNKTATFTNDNGISQISMGLKDGNIFLTSSDK